MWAQGCLNFPWNPCTMSHFVLVNFDALWQNCKHLFIVLNPLFCLMDLFSFTLFLPMSDTLERQIPSPSVSGTTRRSTKSRERVFWAVSVSCPTPSTDSKTQAVSTFFCVCVCAEVWSLLLCSVCMPHRGLTLRYQSGLLVKADGEVKQWLGETCKTANLSSHMYAHTSCTRSQCGPGLVSEVTETNFMPRNQGECLSCTSVLSGCSS